MSHEVIVVLCTAPVDEAVIARLCRGLCAERLAACVNVVPGLRSFYWWDGAVQGETEVQLIIKTRRSRFEALEAWLKEHHPYDEPEVIALPITEGSAGYLGWVEAQTQP